MVASTEASRPAGPPLVAPDPDTPPLRIPGGGPSPAPSSTHRRHQSAVDRAALPVAYLVASAPFVGGALLDAMRGWLPYGDDAVISWRAASVLSTHGPLVGQITLARAPGRTAFDLGPLLYWLLTVPIHLDPVHGALWGAALWCAAAAALTVTAGRTVGGSTGALVAAAVFPALALALPEMPLDPAWNPSIGLCWFVAMAACAVAVGSGRRRWLPVLVAVGSVAAQCHLTFAVGVPGAVAVALGLGLAATPAGARAAWRVPVLVATGVGVACWTPTVIQQLTGRPGNITAILQGTGGHPVLGWTTAVRAMGSAVGPHPLWSQRLATMPFFTFIGVIIQGDLGAAVVVTVLLVVVAIGALRSHHAALGAAAVLALVLNAGVVVALAHYPSGEFLSLHYVLRSADAAGILSWLVLAWGGVVGCRSAIRWTAAHRQGRPARRASRDRQRWWRAGNIALAGVALAAAALVPPALTAEQNDPSLALTGRISAQVRAVDAAMRPALGREPVLVTIVPDPSLATLGGLSPLLLSLGVAWLAHTQGFDVRMPAFDAAGIGPQAGPLPGIRRMRVTFHGGRPVATILPGQPAAPALRSG